MKKILIAAILFFTIVSVNAQMRAIPSEVTDAFKMQYPTAAKINWKDNITNFEAEFTNDGVNTSAKYTTKGTWIETDRDLKFTDLNSSIKDGFAKSKYKDWEVKAVKEINEKDKAIMYRITIKKSDVQLKYLYFAKNGQLKKEALTL
jgi:hypothetical protein